MDSELMNLALLSSPSEMLEAARWCDAFEFHEIFLHLHLFMTAVPSKVSSLSKIESNKSSSMQLGLEMIHWSSIEVFDFYCQM